MYWTLLIIAAAGLILLGAVAARELRKPCLPPVKRTLVAAWLIAAGATAWWAAAPGAAPLVIAVCGFGLLGAALNREHQQDRRRTPHQPPL